MSITNRSVNLSAICLTEEQQLIITQPVDRAIQHYVFPIQFVLGFTGNALNLLVLLSKRMRHNTATLFLAAMAFADLLTLCCLLLRCLASFNFFARNASYYVFYNEWKNYIVGATNWFSAASIWLVVAVTVERLIAIRYPLQAKFYLSRNRVLRAIVIIAFKCFVYTFPSYFVYEIKRVLVCADTQVYYQVIGITHEKVQHRHSAWVRNYVKYGTVAQIFLVILIPTFLLVTLSIFLVCSLRQHKQYFLTDTKESRATGPSQDRTRSNEQKVSIMVVVIVISFILTNMPSAFVYIWHLCEAFGRNMPYSFYVTAWISNSLAVTGKVLNFFLFCLSSSHFRQELMKIVTQRHSKFSHWMGTQRTRLNSTTKMTTTATSKATKLVLETQPYSKGKSSSQENIQLEVLVQKRGNFRKKAFSIDMNAVKWSTKPPE